MKPKKWSAPDVSKAERRELEVAAAVARDGVAQLHTTRALRMIDLAQGQVSAPRMLEIYIRLMGLQSADAVTVANRALATLGRRETRDGKAVLFVEGEDEPLSEGFSLVTAVRDRLRGRVNHTLRRQIELHTGATHVALVELHVRHALEFVERLKETHTISHACSMYVDMAGVASNLKEPLYMAVLNRLAEVELPKPVAKPAKVAKIAKPEEVRRPKAI